MTSLLQDLTYDTVDNFTLGSARRPAKVLDVYDADTIKIAILIGDTPAKFTMRLTGIVTPERNAKGADRNRVGLERTCAYRARARLLFLLTKQASFADGKKTYSNQDVRDACSKSTRLIQIEPNGFDKYGRVLGRAYLDDEQCINEVLLAEGYAKEYDGGRREIWDIETLEKMLSGAADQAADQSAEA